MATLAASVFTAAKERLPMGQIASGAITMIYILLIVVGILTCILIADRYYPFLPMNPFGGPSALARDVKRFWTTASYSSENLIVPETESPTDHADIYSMSVQLVLGDSRTPSLGQFRHILHRGSNPCGITSSGVAGITADAIPSGNEGYKTTGLPAIMNPGVFLDKYKNDIHVFVHTLGTENKKEVLLLESMTVEDLPLHTPLNLGIICNGKNLEVYLNCKLYSTILLKGTPYLPKSDNKWFGRYCAFPMYGIVKNLQLWPTALAIDDYKNMCPTMSIGPIEMPKMCPTS